MWGGAALKEPEPCAPCAEAPGDPQLAADLAWLADEQRLGASLAAYLARVYRDRFAGSEQHHVAFFPGVGNPIFRNEKPDPQARPPDAGYRLLALFRFWNVIEYWFPYRDQIEEDWDGVLAEFVPRLVAAREAGAYELELQALIARVNDTHANLLTARDPRPPSGDHQLPVRLRFVEERPCVLALDGAAGEDGALAVGDVLLALDGVAVEDLVNEWSPWYSASNQPTRLRDIARTLTRGPAAPVRVRFERAGETREIEAPRVPCARPAVEVHDLPGETFRLLSPEVAYLKLSSVRADDVADQVRAAQGTRGLVIDIRNYPSEFVVFALGELLVREPTPFARLTASSARNPGAFAWTATVELQPRQPRYEGRVVILVDECSQSQSEYTAMAFRAAPDALVVGSTTAGADGNVSSLALPGGFGTLISGIGIFHPDGTRTQRIGILPDLEVRPTIAGLRAGRDEVLEAGLRAILADAPESEIRRIASEALAARR